MSNSNEVPPGGDVPDPNEEFYNTVKRYLLGMLSEAEKESFDQFAFFTDEGSEEAEEGNLEMLDIAEEKLIDDYLAGNLSAEEKERFENYYLQPERNRQKYEEAKALRDAVLEQKDKKED